MRATSARDLARSSEPAERLPADVAALATLLPRVFAATIGLTVAFAAIRGTDGAKAWDRAMFVIVVALAALLCVQFIIRPPDRVANIVTSAGATGGLLVGIARVERPWLPGWDGFGVLIALGALHLAVYLWRS